MVIKDKNNIKYFDNINRCNSFFLTKIKESRSSLCLTITESSTYNKVYTKGKSEFEIFFYRYIGFNILDESLVLPEDEYEIFYGNHFLIYQKSHYLDYISKSTFASDEHPGPFTHFGINCLNHIVHIVSTEIPEIKKIS